MTIEGKRELGTPYPAPNSVFEVDEQDSSTGTSVSMSTKFVGDVIQASGIEAPDLTETDIDVTA